jgi:hypothetical protein
MSCPANIFRLRLLSSNQAHNKPADYTSCTRLWHSSSPVSVLCTCGRICSCLLTCLHEMRMQLNSSFPKGPRDGVSTSTPAVGIEDFIVKAFRTIKVLRRHLLGLLRRARLRKKGAACWQLIGSLVLLNPIRLDSRVLVSIESDVQMTLISSPSPSPPEKQAWLLHNNRH